MGDNVAYMRENHHKYQSKPYPKKSVILYTPEREFATKILSILDFYDSAITRIDKDKKKTKQTQEEFTSYQEARIKLEEEYRNLEIEYNKDKFPKLRMKGQEFIDLMYNEKIFRNKDYWWITPMKLISKELGHEVELETRLNPFR